MISVTVPVYNIEEYVGSCIESILAQTYKNLEVIIVDDGSTDGSGEICDRYAAQDGRVKVIHKENGGLVSARKEGLVHAGGEYIACVDGDDWLECDALEKAVRMGNGADMVCFAAFEEYENGEQGTRLNGIREGAYKEKGELDELHGKMLMNGNFFEVGVLPYQWGKLIRKELLLQCQKEVPDTVSYAEDTACIYPCLLKAKSVFISNEPLYHYRIRQSSMVGKEVSMEKLEEVFRVLKKGFSGGLTDDLKYQLESYRWQTLLLKGYGYLDGLMPLFPFPAVKPGMKVAVYGAGLFGQVIYGYCLESDNLSVVGWFDKRYGCYAKQGMDVRSGAEVAETDFDMLVIAILNVELAKKIKEDYIKQGVPGDKIEYIHAEMFSPELRIRVLP